MVERNPASPGENGQPIPRDLPDQQYTGESDPLDMDVAAADADGEERSGKDVPQTDEGGTGRRGATDSGRTGVEEDPDAQEPTG
ncbi:MULTISPECIES: hypothetical protein [unclassified Streptomyces]|uniref:hypothetical protein n=1 Tax=unclassified Streptomyces TaxID=2593676 RepID=UPI00074B09AA|nr:MULTISPECIES: hypothetical protein [unclassified Streptomyces]KUL52961.1 hypothetical protein ADL30_21775 [Streptomyces sp. NRRL S-1521]THC51902.1 hypothetical protein E7X58_12970 [Streptomyces sp. A1499]